MALLGLKILPQWSESKLSVPSIYIVVLDPGDQSYYVLSSSTLYDYTWLKLISVITVLIYICFLFILELIQIFTLKHQYSSSGKWLENLPNWITIISTSIFIIGYLTSQYNVSVPALSIAMLFGK